MSIVQRVDPPGIVVRYLSLTSREMRAYEHPSQASYHRPPVAPATPARPTPAYHDATAPLGPPDPVREVGATPEALEALDAATQGARLVRRTGPSTYVVVGAP